MSDAAATALYAAIPASIIAVSGLVVAIARAWKTLKGIHANTNGTLSALLSKLDVLNTENKELREALAAERARKPKPKTKVRR